VQEGPRRGAYLDDFATSRHLQPIKRANRTVRLALDRAEGREIVSAEKGLRRRVHRPGIERFGNMPDTTEIERGGRAAVQDAEEIVPRGRRKAGVEILAHGLNREDRDRVTGKSQMRVERAHKLIRRPIPGKIDMRHLPRCMDAGIGAPRATDRHALGRESEDRVLDRLLHTRLIGLPLPARKGPAVILDVEPETRHHISEKAAA
jgi:hypothetical protein